MRIDFYYNYVKIIFRVVLLLLIELPLMSKFASRQTIFLSCLPFYFLLVQLE